ARGLCSALRRNVAAQPACVCGAVPVATAADPRGGRRRPHDPGTRARLTAGRDRAHGRLSTTPAAARLLPAGRAEAAAASGRRAVSVRFEIDERALAAAVGVVEQQRVGILV